MFTFRFSGTAAVSGDVSTVRNDTTAVNKIGGPGPFSEQRVLTDAVLGGDCCIEYDRARDASDCKPPDVHPEVAERLDDPIVDTPDVDLPTVAVGLPFVVGGRCVLDLHALPGSGPLALSR